MWLTIGRANTNPAATPVSPHARWAHRPSNMPPTVAEENDAIVPQTSASRDSTATPALPAISTPIVTGAGPPAAETVTVRCTSSSVSARQWVNHAPTG